MDIQAEIEKFRQHGSEVNELDKPSVEMKKLLLKLKKNLVGKYGSMRRAAEKLGVTPSMLSMVVTGKRSISAELKAKLIPKLLTDEDFSYVQFENKKQRRIVNEYLFIIEKQNDITLHQEYLIKHLRDVIDRLQRNNENLHNQLIYLSRKLNQEEKRELRVNMREIP